jgi:hypothetical protein
MPAVVPGDAGFSIDERPGAVGRAESLSGGSVGVEGDVERAAIVALTDLPLAYEMRAGGHHGEVRCGEFNSIDVGGKLFAVAVFVDDRSRGLYVDMGDVGERRFGSGGKSNKQGYSSDHSSG